MQELIDLAVRAGTIKDNSAPELTRLAKILEADAMRSKRDADRLRSMAAVR